MPIYQVKVTDDITLPIDADNPEDARKIAKSKIATQEISPYTDKLFFDYEEGVPNVERLRSLLGRAETPQERESVLNKVVGSGGYTYDSKGLPAITPEGLKRLGLNEKIKYKTLPNGEAVPQNIIVDENSFNLRTGDLADFSGVVGPIVGTLAALLPQARIAGGLLKLFGGNGFAARTVGAGLGSASGKLGEEALDAVEGIQLQDKYEIANLAKGEFAFGAIGQGIGEVAFLGYTTLLGKQAPFDNLRFYRQQTKGRSIVDIKKLDKNLGREATEKEINAAVKKGIVEVYKFKAVPSQSALNRKIPGRLQAVAEQVLGNKRQIQTKQYLFAELNKLSRAMNGEDIALDRYVSSSIKGELDEQVASRLSNLRGKEANVTKIIDDLFEEITENSLNIGNYKNAPVRQDIGEDIIKTLSQARSSINVQLGKKYRAIDEQLLNLSKDPDINNGIKRAMNEVIEMRFREIDELIKKTESSNPALYFPNSSDDIMPGQITNLKKTISELRDKINRGEFINLVQIRNMYSDLNSAYKYSLFKNQKSDLLGKIVKVLDAGPDAKPGHSGSIMTDFENPNVFVRKVDGKLFNKNLIKEDSDQLAKVVKDLRDTNKLSYERLQPFDDIKIKKIVNDMRDGSFDADQVYVDIIQNGKADILNDVFRALKDHDSYLSQIGKSADAINENTLRKQLQRRVFLDAYTDAFDVVDNSIDFTKFVRSINKFEGQYPGKLDILFPDNIGEVRAVLAQVNKISPNVFNKKPQELLNLIDDITKTESGLNKSGAGRQFLEKLTEKAEAAKATTSFEQNAIIKRLPTSGVDEVADVIFKPNSAGSIELVKETVTPEVFKSIQDASMTKLLRKSIDVNSDKITDIFRAGNLKSALDSYGDDTLNAMFGREVTSGLKAFQKSMDTLTLGEVGRGGAAGTLVAAGIAVNALSIGMIPTIAGLALMRTIFSKPSIVGLLAKKDPGSIARVIQAFERSARQLNIRLIGDQVSDTKDIVQAGVESGLKRSEEELKDRGILDEAKNIFDDAKNTLQDATENARRVIPRQSSIEMPTVRPVSGLAGLGGLSEDRIDFAERISGRPII
tara:strand:+ start:3443 stop:6679 length:3237 start_codon:yes stop_codon:yes gene_type:complete